MTVMNNGAAMMSLGELNKNISKAAKDLKKVSSGMRLNSAGDDASGYAISEKMRTRLHSLVQDDQNVQNGVSLLKVAAGGIEDITDELRSLKELAINAANDTNTDADRATIQKEFDQRRAQIDAIASGTTYNGKVLLDGRYSQTPVIVTTSTFIAGTPNTAGKLVDPGVIGPTGAIAFSGAVEPTGTPVTINSNNYTVTQAGVYALDSGAGTVTIATGVHDVKFVQAKGATLSNIQITGPSDGNANLWIEDLDVTNGDDMSFLRFQGTNNVFNFKGTNTISTPMTSTTTWKPPISNHAVIHVGGGLTVEGGAYGTGKLIFNNDNTLQGALIGTDDQEQSSASVTVNSGTFTDYDSMDVIVGSGSSTVAGVSRPGSSCGDIVVKNATIIAPNKMIDPAIGNGYETGRCGSIYIANSDITVKNQAAAGIGSSEGGTITSNIMIENSNLNIQCQSGAGIGSGRNGSIGDITLNNCNYMNVTSKTGDAIGKGENGTCGAVRFNTTVPHVDAPAPAMTYTPGTPDQTLVLEHEEYVNHPLVIHHGTKSNEKLHFYLNDMRTTALKEKGGRTLDETSVRTQKDVSDAISVVDGALDYALGEATTVGAYISRLRTTDANIVTMNETTTASESTIRDADMAKEMTSYMKNNVLLQASQSMLAQANRSSTDVLKLLQ